MADALPRFHALRGNDHNPGTRARQARQRGVGLTARPSITHKGSKLIQLQLASFGFTGATCAVIIMFLIPTASFLEVFSDSESNGDGTVSLDEATTLLGADRAKEVMREYDADGSGTLDADETSARRLVALARKEGRKIEGISSCERWTARGLFVGGFLIGIAWYVGVALEVSTLERLLTLDSRSTHALAHAARPSPPALSSWSSNSFPELCPPAVE